jgi:hypothetical protein
MDPKNMNRRAFLKSTIAGFSSFIFLPFPKEYQATALRTKAEKMPKIPARVLGKTGIKVPLISMGVMNTSNPALVKAALDAGMHFLDTAQTYQRGTNEAMIGEVLKGRPRDSFVIATKARLPQNPTTGLYTEEATEEAYAKKIDTSLKNLGLDYVDIYYHHNVWVRESALYEPIINALQKAKKAGKTRFIGITTHRNEPEVIQAAMESKVYDVVLTAYNFRQKHAAEVKKAIAKAAEAGLGVVAMKTIGGNVRGAYGAEEINAQVGLKWVLQDQHVHTIIAGFTTFDQMELDLKVMQDFTFSWPEREYLQAHVLSSAYYCQGCGLCLTQCPQSLPIPELMRAYMYAFSYKNLVAAQDLLFSLDLPYEACKDCASCAVKCTNQWQVGERIRQIVVLREISA